MPAFTRAQAKLDKEGWWKSVCECWDKHPDETEKMLQSVSGAVRPHLAT